MAYMLILRATEESQAAAKDVPFEDVINAMGFTTKRSWTLAF